MGQDESAGTPRSAAAGYAVGYGKPPPHTRFRKGVSGNPRGRPRRKTDLASLLAEALDRRNASKKRQPRTQREAIIAALVEKSADGDLRAVKLLFDLMRQIGLPPEPPASPEEDPREILLRRLARLAGEHVEPG
ncbi:MAG: DUF5681 domain-containing protein [Alphaproteobacteria bacterium]